MKQLIFFLLLFFTLRSHSQNLYFNPNSIQRHPGNFPDTPIDLKSDKQGNIYFIDNTHFFNTANYNGLVALVKCNANGDTLWSRYFNTSNTLEEYASTMAIDNSGNIIIAGDISPAGYDQYDAYVGFVSKISPNGILLATDTFSNGQSKNTIKSIAIDGQNNIYVLASSGNFAARHILLYKLDSVFQHVWHRTYTSVTNQHDIPCKVVCDTLNNVYLGGTIYASQGNNNILVQKYSSSGILQWGINYDYNALNATETLESMLLNDTSIYLLAQSYGGSLAKKSLVIKVSQIFGNYKDTLFQTANNNNFKQNNFICRSNELACGIDGDSAYVFVMDTAFNLKFIRGFKGTSTNISALHRCSGISFNNTNDLLISLRLDDSLRVGNKTYFNAHQQFVKLDNFGNLIYSKKLYNFVLNYPVRGSLIFAANKAYLLEQDAWNNSDSPDIFLTTIDETSGNMVNKIIFNCKETGASVDRSMFQVHLSNGNIVVANSHSYGNIGGFSNGGYSWFHSLQLINSNLQNISSVLVRDSLSVSDSILFLGKDAYDNIYTVVSREYRDSLVPTLMKVIIRVEKYDANLQQLWMKDISYGGIQFKHPAVTVSDSGSIAMCGFFNTPTTIPVLLKLNNAGAQQWLVPLSNGSFSSLTHKGLLSAQESTLFLYGSFSISGYQNFSVVKINAGNGAIQLVSSFADSIVSNSYSKILNNALLHNGKIIGTGSYNTSQFTACIDTATLLINWIKFLKYGNVGNPIILGAGVSVIAHQNNVFVLGYEKLPFASTPHLNKMMFTCYDFVNGTTRWAKKINSSWLLPTQRFASIAANGITAVLVSPVTMGTTTNMDFSILNYNYTSGALVNTLNWGYYIPNSCNLEDVPLNVTANGTTSYFISGYAKTHETNCYYNEFSDTFYGSLNPSIISEVEDVTMSENKLLIFPNPASSCIYLESEKEIRMVGVYNTMGQMLYKTDEVHQLSAIISAKNFLPGIYIVNVVFTDNTTERKMIVVE